MVLSVYGMLWCVMCRCGDRDGAIAVQVDRQEGLAPAIPVPSITQFLGAAEATAVRDNTIIDI